MSNPWFRLYSEAVDDEKLRLLAFEDRWHFVALLCCKNKGILDSNDELMRRKVAVKLGLDSRELDEVARRLSEVGLIDMETLQPINWDSRQFKTDSSKERTKAYRERIKRHSDVTVTAQETDTDTETDTETDIEQPAKELAIKKKSTKNKSKELTSVPSTFDVDENMFDWAVSQGVPDQFIKTETEQFLDRCKANNLAYKDWNAAWRTWMRNAVKYTYSNKRA